eukprot:gene4992-6776_t
MSEKPSADLLNRRRFLGAAGLAGAGVALSSVPGAAGEAGKPDPLITDVPDWNRSLGDGVQSRPYGSPSKFEKDVVRRDVSWLTECIDDVLADPQIRMRAVIIPMRDLAEAATSRVVTERHAIHAGAPFMAWMRRPWAVNGGAPGGVLYSLDAVDQARLLAVGFHVLVQRLVRAEVPIIFLDFPRLVQDGAYLFARLRP